jgi:hypothetical protein
MAFLRALTSFAGATADGGQVDIFAGQTVREEHPAVKGREHLFEPLDDTPEVTGAKVNRVRPSTSGKTA